MNRLFTLCLALFLSPAYAEVSGLSEGGFTTSHVRQIAAAPEEVYRHLVNPAAWWEPDHSWSGDGDNFYFKAEPHGCFCEKLDNGGWVEHLGIIYLDPGKEIRLRGALGPLMQMGFQGTMSWKLEAIDDGTRFTWTYIVLGRMEGGFESLAPVVDAVNGAQLENLARLSEEP